MGRWSCRKPSPGFQAKVALESARGEYILAQPPWELMSSGSNHAEDVSAATGNVRCL